MNVKERVCNAIRFKGVDRIPITYRAIPYVSNSLLKYFGISDSPDLIRDYKKLIKKLDADLYSQGAGPGAFSIFVPKCSATLPEKPFSKDVWFFYALGINSTETKIEEYNWKYFTPGVKPPLADINYASDLKKDFLLSKLKYFNFKSYSNRIFEDDSYSDYPEYLNYDRIKSANDDFISIGTLNQPFMICCYLRGMDQFMMDLAANRKLAEYIIKEVGQFCIEFVKKELEEFNNKAEWYFMWDDVAGQNGLFFKPELFKKYFLPVYKEMIGSVKKYDDLIFSWHCCGSVNDILPSMIDSGIDVFDVVQTSAKDMELEKIYKRYGKSVCIHGGIDVQQLMVFGNPEQIKKEVIKARKLWGFHGGLILAPSHDIIPGTPIENILAMYNCA